MHKLSNDVLHMGKSNGMKAKKCLNLSDNNLKFPNKLLINLTN